MGRIALVAVVWAGLVTAAAPAVAQDLPAKEQAALARVERELIGVAQYAARGHDWDAAQAELRLGLEVWPGAPRIPGELARVQQAAARGGRIAAGFDAKLSKKRDAAHAKVGLALADAAAAAKADAPDRYERYLGLVQRRFPSDAALARLDIAYFAPYFSWFSRDAVARLEAGGELIDGQWLDTAAVAALNAGHAAWSNPWRISDEVHEVQTTLPYRTANQILCYVGAYRRWFLERFAGTWDLRPPDGKLPVIVTRTRAEMDARMAEATGGRAGDASRGAAFYLQTNGRLNPCFVSYEIVGGNGVSIAVDKFEDLLIGLTHEITHQICFEYSKHDFDDTRQITHQFWSVEAIANFLCYYVYDGTAWRLTKPKTIGGTGGYYAEGPFYWCQEHRTAIPPIHDFVRLGHQQFMTAENYHIAATLAYFLLEGAEGHYRTGFIKLLEAVHKVRDTPTLFDTAFPGLDYDVMQREFLAFIAAIPLDG